MTDSKLKDRIRARWDAFQPTKVGSFWALVFTVIGTMILGFGAAGWTTAGSAQEMADNAAENARAQLAGAICVEKFLASENAQANLADFKTIDYSFKRREFVQEGGWAMMPGDTASTSARAAANQCATALYEHTGVVAAS